MIGLLALTAIGQSSVGNLSGMWIQVDPGVDNKQTLNVFHKGSEYVHITYGKFNGITVVGRAIGTVKGNKIEFDYDFALCPDGWLPGHVSATVSPDGKTVSGTWYSHGSSGPIVYYRVE